MKSLVFDTGTIISLVTNNLLWILKPLKKRFDGEFLIPRAVKSELIDRPLKINRFKLEAVVIQNYLHKGVFKFFDNKNIEEKSKYLLGLANNIYFVKDKPIKIVQEAEMDALATVIELGSDALVVDERTLRLLVENPYNLSELLSGRLHTKIVINKKNLNELKKAIGNVNIIRSIELAVIAFDLGILDRYITVNKKIHNELKRDVLDGALWGLKFKGCAISSNEIKEVLRLRNF